MSVPTGPDRSTGAIGRWRGSRAARAWSRYGRARGNVLAGGVAYFGFFSFFPALAVALTAVGVAIGHRTEAQHRVIDYVNSTFGGAVIIGSTPGTGLVSMDRLVRTNLLTVVGIVGLLGLVLTGLGWIGALRQALTAVFDSDRELGAVRSKLVDLAAGAGFGLAAGLSMAASVVVTAAGGTVLSWMDLGRSRPADMVINVVTALVVLVIDTATFLLLFRLLAGVDLPRDDLFGGALLGGVSLGLLKLAGGMLLRYSSGNRFFAAFVIVAGLLLWMNLAARASLLAAAWAATTAQDRGHLLPAGAAHGPASPPARGDVLRTDEGRPRATVGERAGDVTTTLAGAVLGVALAVSVRVVTRAGVTVRDALRGAPSAGDDAAPDDRR